MKILKGTKKSFPPNRIMTLSGTGMIELIRLMLQPPKMPCLSPINMTI
jgi:hypothetical protein